MCLYVTFLVDCKCTHGLLILLTADNTLLVELTGAIGLTLRFLDLEACRLHITLGLTEVVHVRNNLDDGNGLADFHFLANGDAELLDGACGTRLDLNLLTRLNGTGGNAYLLNVALRRIQ